MAGCARVALCCAVLVAVAARAAAYTVDCNHEYTDCDTELSKLSGDEDDQPPQKAPSIVEISTPPPATTPFLPTIPPFRPTLKPPEEQVGNKTDEIDNYSETTAKPKARLLNLNVDELQNFANALHNQTQSNEKSIKKHLDLSDVNLDAEEEDEPPRMMTNTKHNKNPGLPEKFYDNLQAPFNSLITNPDRVSEEVDMCKDNDIFYKIGEKIERGCDEECECAPGGVFDCTPRCKHPYIRRGRRLNDPLCFESPVDECCSIIACATGNGKDMKVTKLEVCRYGNDTHQVGTKWHIGCEQTCSCERNSVVTCKPRCKALIPSDKCINVQDPNDACCEVQVCDVSQDVHEEPVENATSTTSTTTETLRGFEVYPDLTKETLRPLVLSEPIGSVKVLQNNSVEVNLMHPNISEDPIHLLLSDDGGRSFKDVELKYSNLILNLKGGKDYILKTKETGTKFNFTMTAMDGTVNTPVEEINDTKMGCFQDGQFYAVGEEFHIGCSELCECTGPGVQECAALVCPSHVGLELVSKGCVRWAPNPPAHPPNCCPRSARCLSDGSCHYKGVAVPNWSEVPLSLTGCEQRCFCENGELDCQEVCTPLSPVPPQSLRCPPMHRPAPVNISEEDCCKQWGCLPNAGNTNGSNPQTYIVSKLDDSQVNYFTPIPPLPPVTAPTLPKPPLATEPIDFYRHLSPVKTYPSYLKIYRPLVAYPTAKFSTEQTSNQEENITVFTLHDSDVSFKTIQPEPPLVHKYDNWLTPTDAPEISDKPLKSIHGAFVQSTNTPRDQFFNYVFPEKRLHNIQQPPTTKSFPLGTFNPSSMALTHSHPIQKIPISEVDKLNFFLPSLNKKITEEPVDMSKHTYFEPATINKTDHSKHIKIVNSVYNPKDDIHFGKRVTILRNKDLKSLKFTGHDKLWNHDPKTHLLTKSPNPYETVLLRALPNAKIDVSSNSNLRGPHVAGKTYSALDLEHLLTQMELESEVNRNLGRSADKGKDDSAAAQSTVPGFPPVQNTHQIQPFLPTIPPEIHYPQEDIDTPDYDQNNIHHPAGTIESGTHGLPPGFTPRPNFGDENKKLTVISLQADSPTSVKMLFGLPPVLVGLRGSVDLRYTDKADEDISQWYSQVFAPAEEVLTTPRLEFRLTGLKPSTTYKMRGKLYLHNLPVEPESDIYSVRTQDVVAVTAVEEKRREIDSRLTVVDVNDTSALVSWRHFVEDELQFIDGIQIRYRPVGTPIYSMTELLHHSRSAVELHDLRPGSRYEASLVMVPPPRATTELHDPGRVEFTTSPFVDPYNWTVTIEARAVGSEAAELTWRGIPSPAERWVRVYRAAHACVPPGTRREHDSFRLAARDLPPTITLTGLEPNNRCRVWLELFLTNGKVKTSNVLEIKTKSLDSPEPIDNVIEASSIAGSQGDPHGDYYGALVVVGVVAALGALTSLLLLLVVVRRHRPHSVPITAVPSAPRESSLPPYDNPAYKLELQQETMDL